MGRENIRLCEGLDIFSLKNKREDSFCVFSKDVSITEQEVVLVIWKKKKQSLIREKNNASCLILSLSLNVFHLVI